MSPFRLPEWLRWRFGNRTTVEEMNEALGAIDSASDNTGNNVPSEILSNETLLFQFIMRRWIDEMDQMERQALAFNAEHDHGRTWGLDSQSDVSMEGRGDTRATRGVDPDTSITPDTAPAVNAAGNTHTLPDIPVLNIDDVNLALREELDRDQRGTFWIKFIDVLGVTLFPLLFLRILKNVFSYISFSDDILEDTDNFLLYILNNSFESLSDELRRKDTRTNSLIFKFGEIVYQELTHYFPNANPLVARILTLTSFYIYTTLTSMFMMVSFVFLLLCVTYTYGRRWGYINKFMTTVTKETNGVF